MSMKLGTQTASVMNHLFSRMTIGQPDPVVGMGATRLMWTDRQAATITRVFKIGKKVAVEVVDDDSVVVKGSVQDGSAEWDYKPNPNRSGRIFAFDDSGWCQYRFNEETKRWNKSASGCGLRIGERETYRDPSF